MPTAGPVCVLCLYYVFILFINDLKLVSFFDEDTRVPKRISCLEDCQLLVLQDDLYKIVDWSRWNNMKLREQKFELPNHLYSKNSVLPELPFHNETLSY